MDNIKFNAALKQFGHASLDLAWETLKYPFSGDWKRMVVTGLPLLFVTAGTGAVIYTVMTRSLRAVGDAFSSVSNKFFNFFSWRTVNPNPPHNPRPSRVFNQVVRQPSPEAVPQAQDLPPLEPLPVDAAEQRNKALIKFSILVEKYVIDPLMEKKELYAGIQCTPQELKSWLMSVSLWRLGLVWEDLEKQYIHMKMAPVQTKETIVAEAKRLNKDIGKVFEDNMGHQTIWDAIDKSPITHKQKITFLGLLMQLEAIAKGAGVQEESKKADENEIRKKFALSMHSGMANTMTHMGDIIEGWLAVMNKPKISLTLFPPGSPSAEHLEENPLSGLVKDVSTQIKHELTTKYLLPVWKKKCAEWNQSVAQGLGEVNHTLFEQYMNGEISETQLLENQQSYPLSTTLTSTLFFMKAFRMLGKDMGRFEKSTEYLLETVFAQLTPTVSDTLSKVADTLTQINFETTVPKVVDYFIALLDSFKTMQVVGDNSADLNRSVLPGDGFIEAMKRAGVEGKDLENIQSLHLGTQNQVSGRKIVKRFPEGKIHKVVLRSFESSIPEQGWIRESKERLRTVLLMRAEKYSQEEGTWLSRLLRSSGTGQPANLMSLFLSYSNKVREIPAFDGIMTFLLSGVEAVLEKQAIHSAQEALNEYTSTGVLSTTIIISVVKGLIAKEDAQWNKNLPLLQQTFGFLQKEEQETVLKHLAAICDVQTFEARKQAIEGAKPMPSLEEEQKYQSAINTISAALTQMDEENYELVAETLERYKRAKELKQFERMRTVVTLVANQYLGEEVFNFKGGDVLKSIALKIIHEGLNLLACQELVKHWIFTIVDLLIEELEENSHSEEVSQSIIAEKPQSLLDLIPTEKKDKLLYSITGLMSDAQKDTSWFSIQNMAISGAIKIVNNILPQNTLWSYVYMLNDKLTISPVQLKDKVISMVGDYGKKPDGLSASIIESLTEYVADPREEKKNLL